jgi:hypothetical protein
MKSGGHFEPWVLAGVTIGRRERLIVKIMLLLREL